MSSAKTGALNRGRGIDNDFKGATEALDGNAPRT